MRWVPVSLLVLASGIGFGLVVAFLGWLVLGRAAIRRQEAVPAAAETVIA